MFRMYPFSTEMFHTLLKKKKIWKVSYANNLRVTALCWSVRMSKVTMFSTFSGPRNSVDFWQKLYRASKFLFCTRLFGTLIKLHVPVSEIVCPWYNPFLFHLNCRSSGHAVQIVQRHHFASHLKRMAVVVRVQEEFFAFVKVCWLLFLFLQRLHYAHFHWECGEFLSLI